MTQESYDLPEVRSGIFYNITYDISKSLGPDPLRSWVTRGTPGIDLNPARRIELQANSLVDAHETTVTIGPLLCVKNSRKGNRVCFCAASVNPHDLDAIKYLRVYSAPQWNVCRQINHQPKLLHIFFHSWHGKGMTVKRISSRSKSVKAVAGIILKHPRVYHSQTLDKEFKYMKNGKMLRHVSKGCPCYKKRRKPQN